jgi:hypothetical protein
MQSKQPDLAGATINLVSAAFVLGTTSTYTTTVTTEHVINGKFGTTLGAQTNTASPTVDANTGLAFPAVLKDQATVLVWGVNAAGAIKLCQGSIVPTMPGVTTTVGGFIMPPQFPALPDDFCPIAYGLVRVSPTGATFTAGTTQWAASGITCSTFQNVATPPDRPQIA